MRVRCSGVTASAASRASRPRLDFDKTDRAEGTQRHQIDLAGMGLDAAAQDAIALQPQPPGRQALAAMAARFGLLCGQPFFFSRPRA